MPHQTMKDSVLASVNGLSSFHGCTGHSAPALGVSIWRRAFPPVVQHSCIESVHACLGIVPGCFKFYSSWVPELSALM